MLKLKYPERQFSVLDRKLSNHYFSILSTEPVCIVASLFIELIHKVQLPVQYFCSDKGALTRKTIYHKSQYILASS